MNTVFSSKGTSKRIKAFLLLLLLPVALFFGCKRQLDYFSYASEVRSNIFLAQEGDFSLLIYAVQKETPYVADGIPQESSHRFEARFTAVSGDKNASITFQIDGKAQGGELSYDNVKSEYFYSCTLDVSKLTEIECHIEYGEQSFLLTAKSVLTAETLTPKNALDKLIEDERDLFNGMTDEYGFSGEIYIRLLYEESPYYYLGVIDREGNTHAFLMNAETGKILAKRTP